MKKILSTFAGFLLALSLLAGCNNGDSSKSSSSEEITIVYTNDVHSYIANTKTDESTKETVPALRLSNVSQFVKDSRSQGKNVLLVDAGDEVQGSSYGAIDKGKSIIELMNKAGYQLACPGNHEFDFGMARFKEILSEADYEFISCNFKSIEGENKKTVLNPDKIFNIGGKKVAFIGISTPETISSSTPTHFQDDEGNFIYTVDGLNNPSAMYDAVQAQIDALKDKADYIIALGHAGVGLDQMNSNISSEDVIKNTTGLNAFIDGHSHTEMEGKLVSDKTGKNVLLTQTGSYLKKFGVMTIDKEGNVTSKLMNEYSGKNSDVEALETALINRIQSELGKKIATLETTLYTTNPENDKQRLIRAKELNLGDFVADSIYWFFNENQKIDCDVAIQNGGGIRATVKKGDVTENDIINVSPFGNVLCVINATGQQLKDALELGAINSGLWDAEWDAPKETGAFMHVAGMKYTIDTKVASSVETDKNDLFVSVKGDYRVKNIEIYNKKTGAYEPIDLEKTYKVGGINYVLRNSGSGCSMFAKCSAVVDFSAKDADALSMYCKSFTRNGDYAEIKTENSALASYSGYLIDYKNPYGAGRITILE